MPISEQQARHNLRNLLDKYNALTPEDRRSMTEAGVVRQFIDILLRDVLGWPIEDTARYKYELHTQVGRPDLTLFPENGGVIFVEAKKFGVIKELEQARNTISGIVTPGQMALPGMAVDRTEEEQQAINYAFANNGTWAILTNFEKLRLFNARRDWLVLSFEEPSAYLREFDQLWQLAYHNVINGSLDALNNQRLTVEVDNVYLSFINEWRERLARNILAQRNSNSWVRTAEGSVNLGLLRAVVQRFLDRLVIIRFAEDHLVIKPGTLRDMYELVKTNPYTFTMDDFIDKFFRRFDEDHNSALFAKGLVDLASFTDETLLPLIAKLYEARYRAMPADILGNTYEQYLGKTLVLDNGSVKSGDNLETRKKQGSYYTPQVIVRYIVDNSLGRYLYATENGKPDGKPIDGEHRKTSADIRDLRVLDSACGSGSFLIYAYYVLAEFYEAESLRLKAEYDTLLNSALQSFRDFDDQPAEQKFKIKRLEAEWQHIRDHYPRIILEQHLYGVDLDPQAAEIAVVNLMMRAMERRSSNKRLPLILNQNVKVGNSLVGLRPDDARLVQHNTQLAELIRLRRLLATDPDKDLYKQLEDLNRERIAQELAKYDVPAVREAMEEYYKKHTMLTAEDLYPTYSEVQAKTDALNAEFNPQFAPHFSDLERVRPFHWGIEFPEVFFNDDGTAKDNGGFTIVFGNPPWEILKPDLREFYAQFDARIESNYTRERAEQRIAELQAEDPRRLTLYDEQTRSIEQTAAHVRASGDYTRQGGGDTATHKLFMERVYGMLQAEGRLGYVVPSGIYTDLGTKPLREMLLNEGNIQYIFSFSNERGFFPGVHHAFKFALLGAQKGHQTDGFWAAFRFNPRVAVKPDELPKFLANIDNLIYMRRDLLKKLNPESLSVMEFQSREDYEIAERVYEPYPLLGDRRPEFWQLQFGQEFHMANDAHVFNQNKQGLPLYEGKMIHQFDAYYYEREQEDEIKLPRYWIDEQKGATDLAKTATATWHEGYRFAFREVSGMVNERTCIAAVLPPMTFAGHTLWVGTAADHKILLYYIAIINSFCIDWLVRFKGGTHITLFLMKSLPVPRLTAGNPYFDALVPRAARLTCTRAEFAALWHDVMGEAWDESKGAVGDERQTLRDEIDALVAHLYGLSRDEFAHILGTFPLVFPDSDAGKAKREKLLATYDRMKL